jgi:hypothetical protein
MRKGIYTIIIALSIGFIANGKGITNPTATAAIATLHITAVAAHDMAAVSWDEAAKIKVRRYVLEKSNDGQHFFYVTAIAGASKSNYSNYTVQDRNVSIGANYYRVKIIDKSGALFYSQMILLDTKAATKEASVLPATVADKLHIWLKANIAIKAIEIADAAGRKCIKKWTINHSSNLAQIDVASLLPGFYSIEIITNRGTVLTEKFCKK